MLQENPKYENFNEEFQDFKNEQLQQVEEANLLLAQLRNKESAAVGDGDTDDGLSDVFDEDLDEEVELLREKYDSKETAAADTPESSKRKRRTSSNFDPRFAMGHLESNAIRKEFEIRRQSLTPTQTTNSPALDRSPPGSGEKGSVKAGSKGKTGSPAGGKQQSSKLLNVNAVNAANSAASSSSASPVPGFEDDDDDDEKESTLEQTGSSAASRGSGGKLSSGSLFGGGSSNNDIYAVMGDSTNALSLSSETGLTGSPGSAEKKKRKAPNKKRDSDGTTSSLENTFGTAGGALFTEAVARNEAVSRDINEKPQTPRRSLDSHFGADDAVSFGERTPSPSKEKTRELVEDIDEAVKEGIRYLGITPGLFGYEAADSVPSSLNNTRGSTQFGSTFGSGNEMLYAPQLGFRGSPVKLDPNDREENCLAAVLERGQPIDPEAPARGEKAKKEVMEKIEKQEMVWLRG